MFQVAGCPSHRTAIRKGNFKMQLGIFNQRLRIENCRQSKPTQKAVELGQCEQTA